MSAVVKLERKQQTPGEAVAAAERRVDAARATVADLENRRRRAELAIAMGDDTAKPLALPAARGDPAATERLAAVRRDQAEARQQIEDLDIAIVASREEVSEASAALVAARDEQVFARAQRLAEEFIDESGKIDSALGAIADAWERRKQLQRELAQTRCLPPDMVDRLVCLVRLNVAVRYASAQMLVAGPARSEQNCNPLASEDRATLARLDVSNRRRQL